MALRVNYNVRLFLVIISILIFISCESILMMGMIKYAIYKNPLMFLFDVIKFRFLNGIIYVIIHRTLRVIINLSR